MWLVLHLSAAAAPAARAGSPALCIGHLRGPGRQFQLCPPSSYSSFSLGGGAHYMPSAQSPCWDFVSLPECRGASEWTRLLGSATSVPACAPLSSCKQGSVASFRGSTWPCRGEWRPAGAAAAAALPLRGQRRSYPGAAPARQDHRGGAGASSSNPCPAPPVAFLGREAAFAAELGAAAVQVSQARCGARGGLSAPPLAKAPPPPRATPFLAARVRAREFACLLACMQLPRGWEELTCFPTLRM